jgi:hypothetical protein
MASLSDALKRVNAGEVVLLVPVDEGLLLYSCPVVKGLKYALHADDSVRASFVTAAAYQLGLNAGLL